MPRSRTVQRSGIAFAVIGCAVLFGPLLYLAWPRAEDGAEDAEASAADTRETPADDGSNRDGPSPAVVDRGAPLLFQPVLVWADDTVTVQGTGFIVEHDRGPFAVTSSHFIVPSEIPLKRLALGSLPALDKLASIDDAWGPMGPCTSQLADDMRDDYLVMPTEPIAGLQRLQLDPRDEIPVGEAVWFPDKNDDSPSGHVVRTGRITHWSPGSIEVALDQGITLQSQSGSPVLSETTNRVLGILGGADSEAGARLYFAPATVLRAVMDDQDRERVPLSHALISWIPREGEAAGQVEDDDSAP